MPSSVYPASPADPLSSTPPKQNITKSQPGILGLRGKILAVSGFTLLVLIGILYITSHVIMLNSLAQIESAETSGDVQRVLNTLSSETAALVSTTMDWSNWDDTYHFAQGTMPDYVDNNLDDSAFKTLKLNLMIFTNASGRIIFGKAYDLNANQEIPIPDLLNDNFGAGGLFAPSSALETPQMGILMVGQIPLEIVAEPILTSASQGPAAGRLIFGWFLDNTHVLEIARTNLLHVAFYPYKSAKLPNDVQQAIPHLSSTSTPYINAMDDKTSAGYSLLDDVYGNPALILRVDVPRTAFEQGQTGISYLILAQAIAGLLCAVVVLWVLERVLLARLVHLNNGLTGIRESQLFSMRVPVEGHDELSSLAQTINETLESLEQSRTSLHHNQELLQTIVTSAPLILFALDPNGVVTLLEGKRLGDLGIHPDDIIGHSAIDDSSPLAEMFTNIASSDELDTGATTTTLGDRAFDIRYTFLRDPQGNLRGLAGVATDITERKQAEQERLEAQRLRLEVEKSRDVLAVQERFISTLSHEFRTPLSVILAGKESLQHYYNRLTVERRAEHFQNIEDQSRRMMALLDDLLTISKTHNGKRPFTPVSLDLVEFCRKLFEEMRMTDKAQRRFVFSCALTSLMAMVDERLLHQILANLLSNAIKYSPSNGEVRFTLAQEGNEAILRISDQGIGIPVSEQAHLFEPFYRASNAKAHQGTGLGLAIVKESVEAHGGSLHYESIEGKGSTFTVRLPLDAKPG